MLFVTSCTQNTQYTISSLLYFTSICQTKKQGKTLLTTHMFPLRALLWYFFSLVCLNAIEILVANGNCLVQYGRISPAAAINLILTAFLRENARNFNSLKVNDKKLRFQIFFIFDNC